MLTTDPGDNGCTVIAIAGRLDRESADQLTMAVERALADDSEAQLVIDLTGLTFWDDFGLAGMLRARSRADASPGASLRLSNVPAQLERHLRVTGLADRFSQSRQ